MLTLGTQKEVHELSFKRPVGWPSAAWNENAALSGNDDTNKAI